VLMALVSISFLCLAFAFCSLCLSCTYGIRGFGFDGYGRYEHVSWIGE
jgi:hypothetical protein